MILDERNEFADATALATSGTGLQLIGDVLDLGVARDVGNGEQLFLVIQVDTAITSAGAATVDFKLVSDAQAAIAVDGSATVHATTGAIAKAALVAGATYCLPLPKEGNAYERYLGIVADVGTAAASAGKVNAFLTHDVAKWKSYDAPFQL